MSIEVTCKLCGEEFDMRHGLCPACVWRVKRVAQLEAALQEHAEYDMHGKPINWCAKALEAGGDR